MTEKSTGKFLLQQEESFANKNPVLQQTARVFHELDQLYFDLGFIGMEETVASKISWWPVVTCIGAADSGKHEFINQYLNHDVFQSGMSGGQNKLSVLSYGDTDQLITLPGTAIDRDPRYPFFHYSDKLENIQNGEGRQINSYLELKTIKSNVLQGKVFISAPSFATDPYDEINPFCLDYVAQRSDLVLVFFDANNKNLESIELSLKKFFDTINKDQNPDKYVFVINQKEAALGEVDLEQWRTLLTGMGLISGRFYSLHKMVESTPKPPVRENRLFQQVTEFRQQDSISTSDFNVIRDLIDHVNIDSAYRIVGALDDSIEELDSVVMHEVRTGINTWKNRSHFTLTLALSVIAVLIVMAEINVGFIAFLIDPIIGPIALLVLTAVMIPLYIYASRQHAKWVIKDLTKKQQEQGMIENLAVVFEKNITMSRILLPVKEHIEWNKNIKNRVSNLQEKAKDLIQQLNDSFSSVANRSSF